MLYDEPGDYPAEEFSDDEAADIADVIIEDEDVGCRLDVVIAARLGVSRSAVQDWIKQGRVRTLEGASVKASDKAKLLSTYLVEIPPLQPAVPEPDPSIPVNVVYEDSHLLVVNKSRGLTVHPGSGCHSGTLVNGLLAYCSDLSGIRGVERPGIVHRLDKDTSGLLVVAKDDQAHAGLSMQFAERQVSKIYQAIVHGVPAHPRGTVNQPIGRHRTMRQRMAVRPTGRSAVTDYEVVETFGNDYALIELNLHTGRTHQIRVHMTWLGYPLVGDMTYGRKPNPWGLEGQALHCCRLGFYHPVRNEQMEFEAPMPQCLLDILTDLRRTYNH